MIACLKPLNPSMLTSSSVSAAPQYASAAYGLAAVMAWGTSDFLGGYATRRANAFLFTTVVNIGGLLVVGTLATAGHAAFPSLRAAMWVLAGGVSGGAALAIFYRALSSGRMGLTAPVAAVLGAAIPTLFSMFTEGMPSKISIFRLRPGRHRTLAYHPFRRRKFSPGHRTGCSRRYRFRSFLSLRSARRRCFSLLDRIPHSCRRFVHHRSDRFASVERWRHHAGRSALGSAHGLHRLSRHNTVCSRQPDRSPRRSGRHLFALSRRDCASGSHRFERTLHRAGGLSDSWLRWPRCL